jgi:hypothetical protein
MKIQFRPHRKHLVSPLKRPIRYRERGREGGRRNYKRKVDESEKS